MCGERRYPVGDIFGYRHSLPCRSSVEFVGMLCCGSTATPCRRGLRGSLDRRLAFLPRCGPPPTPLRGVCCGHPCLCGQGTPSGFFHTWDGIRAREPKADESEKTKGATTQTEEGEVAAKLGLGCGLQHPFSLSPSPLVAPCLRPWVRHHRVAGCHPHPGCTDQTSSRCGPACRVCVWAQSRAGSGCGRVVRSHPFLSLCRSPRKGCLSRAMLFVGRVPACHFVGVWLRGACLPATQHGGRLLQLKRPVSGSGSFSVRSQTGYPTTSLRVVCQQD